MPEITFLFDPHRYYLNPYSIAPLLVSNFSLFVAVFFYFDDRSQAINRGLIYFSLSAGLWLWGNGYLFNSLYPSNAFFWSHVMFTGIILTAAAAYHLSVTVTDKYGYQKNILRFIYGEAAVLTAISWSPVFFYDFKKGLFGFYPQGGLLVQVLVLFVVSCFIISFINLVHAHSIKKDSAARRQLRLFMLLFLALQMAFNDIFCSFDAYIYPFGYLIIFGFLLNILFLQLRTAQELVRKSSQNFHNRMEEKARELTTVVEELRATHLKLLESGKTSALASLSAGILHQISQPITAIHGFIRFLKKEMKPEEPFYRPICLIEEQSVYLKQMLGDLMELVRHRQIKKENININEVINRGMNLLTDELRMHRVNWDVDLDEDMPFVYADSIHIQQIVMNIVMNAMQALVTLPRGSQRMIHVSTEYRHDENYAYIHFKDTGPGIMLDDKHMIFEPFFSTKTDGAGIGLALSQDLVAEHGGNIMVENRPEGGAHFMVRLPVAAVKT